MADLEPLLAALAKAKVAEGVAKAARIEAEDAVVACIEDAPERGSMTIAGGALKCTVKFSLTYKANVDALRELDLGTLPLKFKPASYEFDKVAYEKLRESDPGAFAKVAAHVVTKPAKTSLALKI